VFLQVTAQKKYSLHYILAFLHVLLNNRGWGRNGNTKEKKKKDGNPLVRPLTIFCL